MLNYTESSVKNRYAAAAEKTEAALCCPVQYKPELLEIIPDEVIEKDYGCGDPSRYLLPGETVLDLGSGTGKICFIASQVVGAEGNVIGIDMTDDMLEVARRNAPAVAHSLGYANVEFKKGRIQDMALDLDLLEHQLKSSPIADANSFVKAEEIAQELRITRPMIPDNSIDAVVSNCVLNLVESKTKTQLFAEIYRVLKEGGRAIISDIVSDEPIPDHMQNDPKLWSGCISGALTEQEFLQAFAQAGFYGTEILNFETKPWQTVEGIEFRSITIRAYKEIKEVCFDRNQALIYKGPFSKVSDDGGHTFTRGTRHAVCDKTYRLFQKSPYSSFFEFLPPIADIPKGKAKPFDCSPPNRSRSPQETKGYDYKHTSEQSQTSQTNQIKDKPICPPDSCSC